MIALTPVAGEPAFADAALVGEWAAVLPAMVAQAQVEPWCSYAVRRDDALVGMASFKGPPEGGKVEIAYLTFKPFEGQGIARQATNLLLAIAREHGVKGLRAHTLPEINASTRVLERAGFECLGDVIDPDDGRVWRWERET